MRIGRKIAITIRMRVGIVVRTWQTRSYLSPHDRSGAFQLASLRVGFFTKGIRVAEETFRTDKGSPKN